ncbi:uncharacterized protein LOC143635903 [Bidens hawaiensis]|uniref:uncharacterized protein LOC143635903 n=1 Tax=Bidens hawaiensis TaxID=980011 RepID=UPI004048F426
MARVHSSTTLAETLSMYCSLFLVVMLVLSCCESSTTENERIVKRVQTDVDYRPCDEIYVVREGETLHTIGDKCGDPYIVEENPHIHDPDDVFPGLVIKITPFKNR